MAFNWTLVTMRFKNVGAVLTAIHRFKDIKFVPTCLNAFGTLLTSILIVTTVGCTKNQLNNSSLPNVYDYRANNLNDLRAGFKNPPRKAGPWVYWFWFDSVVSKEEITRELEEMAEAGIGGVEVRDVTMHGFSGKPGPRYAPEDWEKLGHKKYLHLSPEYIDILEHTLNEAERLGLYFSINLGQGWPPGGRWITEEYRSKHLLSSGHRLAGPLKLEGSAAVSVLENTLVSAWRLSDDHEVIPDTYLDLSDSVNADGQLDWEVPEGEWLLGLFQTVSGGLVDKGGGPEVDPASKEAVLFHLNFMFDRLTPKLGRFFGSTFVDVATDSWEYVPSKVGRYWSPALVKHSEEVLGYALEQRMYSLLEYGPDKEAFEADLLHLEETLIRKNFFETVTEFLNERGIRHRPQIYGRGLERDLLESYAVVNSPEIEEGRYVVEAVWAGRLMGKPIISEEAFTFISVQDGNLLRDYRGQYGRGSSVDKNDMWKATPERMIHLSNSHFARGLTRIQMCCFSYSPLGVPHPGWRLYAEAHINRNASWWPEMPRISSWIARNQLVLQSGVSITENLVYPVKQNPVDGPYNIIEGQPSSAINSVDGAHEGLLGIMQEAGTSFDDRIQNIILIEDIRFVDEVSHLVSFLEKDIPVWCVSTVPDEWSVFSANTTSETKALLERVHQAHAKGLIHDARGKTWKEVAEANQSVRWEPQEAKLSFQHRRIGDAPVYLISSWEEPFEGELVFRDGKGIPEIWNAHTGEAEPAQGFKQINGSAMISLQMDRNDSRFVVFKR